MRNILYTILAILGMILSSQAQMPEKVGGLLAVDRAAANLSATESPYSGLTSIIDKQSTFFVPSSVNALSYMNNRPNLPDKLNWEPNFALVSRSLDWGVTSGKTFFQKIGSIKRYGQYVAIWRRDKKGNWRIHVRAEVENFGKGNSASLLLMEPDDKKYLRHRSHVRLGQREEVVTQTDILFSTVLKADTRTGYKEFLDKDARFYFPWKGEIVGKDNVIRMLTKDQIEIDTHHEGVGRAYSGEFAYTSGSATVGVKGKEVVKFNYIRVWKVNDDFEWRVILEMMFER